MTAHNVSSFAPAVAARGFRGATWLLMTLSLVGCSLDFVPEENKKKPATETGDLGAFADLTLTSGAANTVSLQSGVAFNIPDGALGDVSEVRLERPKQSVANEYMSYWTGAERIVAGPHLLSPYALELAKTAVLTLPVEGVGSAEFVTTLWLENESDTTWENLGPAPVKSDRAFIPISKLGIYLLVEFDPDTIDWDADFAGLSLDNLEGYDFDAGIPDQYRQ